MAFGRLGFRSLTSALGMTALVACRGRSESFVGLQRMQVQSRYAPEQASSFFADGNSMRPPPIGTIPSGFVDGDSTSIADAVFDERTIAEGRTRFHVVCAACHGPAGFGGSRVGANLVPYRPPSLHTDRVRALSAAQLERVITDGVGRMPSTAWQLLPRQRRAVAAYVVRLARSPASDSVSRADSLAAARLVEIDESWDRLVRERRAEGDTTHRLEGR